MTSYAKETPADRKIDLSGHEDAPPDPTGVVTHHMLVWMRKRGRTGMPAPAPALPSLAAEWWLDKMQEPEKPGETRRSTVSAGDGTRWDLGYANRCAFAFLRWADMPEVERHAVCAGVMDDRVPYRGDTFPDYRDLVTLTLKMREHVNPREYAEKSIARARRQISRIVREAA